MASTNANAVSAINSAQLDALWSCVRFAVDTEHGRSTPAPVLDTFAEGEFESAVRRHRLALVLSPVLDRISIPEGDSKAIKQLAREQGFKSLAMAKYTGELVEILRQASVRSLVLKGVALAVQTTGEVGSRRSVDVDLWISPEDLERAISSLEAADVIRDPGIAATDFSSPGFRYSKWALAELPMTRNGLSVDLHWWPSQVRGILPTFDTAWRRRQELEIAGTTIPTLGLSDAFTHSCAHAQHDSWYWLRSLVDVDRLANRMTLADIDLLDLRQVAPTATVAYAVTRDPNLRQFAGAHARNSERIIALARAAQQQRVIDAPTRWRPATTWRLMAPRIRQSRGVGNIARVAANGLLPVPSFIADDGVASLTVPQAIGRRAKRLGVRLAGRGEVREGDRGLVRG